MPRHAVILGCGRSGTSIFGELFESLPDYDYLSEPYFEDLLKADFSSPIAVKVPRASRRYPAPTGLSFPFDCLNRAITETPVYFWIVRHPLDAIASLRVGISANWSHHPRPPDWKDWVDAPLVQRCAQHWVTINSSGYKSVRDFARVVKFEDMLVDPPYFAANVCKSLGIDANRCDEHISRWAGRVQNTNNDKFVEAETSRRHSRPDHSVRVGRWKENLGKTDLELVWPMVEKTASAFGYDLESM